MNNVEMLVVYEFLRKKPLKKIVTKQQFFIKIDLRTHIEYS